MAEQRVVRHFSLRSFASIGPGEGFPFTNCLRKSQLACGDWLHLNAVEVLVEDRHWHASSDRKHGDNRVE
jgi:hypothetical protein